MADVADVLDFVGMLAVLSNGLPETCTSFASDHNRLGFNYIVILDLIRVLGITTFTLNLFFG